MWTEKINLNFYFLTSFWCLKRFYEGLTGIFILIKLSEKHGRGRVKEENSRQYISTNIFLFFSSDNFRINYEPFCNWNGTDYARYLWKIFMVKTIYFLMLYCCYWVFSSFERSMCMLFGFFSTIALLQHSFAVRRVNNPWEFWLIVLNTISSKYVLKANIRSTRKRCEECSKSTIKTPLLTLNIFFNFFQSFYC